MRRVLILAVAAAGAALLVAAAGTPRTVKEGGTFRMAVPVDWFDAVDPALAGKGASVDVIRATCGALLHHPNKPL
jgi:ABC-type oligopeptide transport system substrate-binding subunit